MPTLPDVGTASSSQTNQWLGLAQQGVQQVGAAIGGAQNPQLAAQAQAEAQKRMDELAAQQQWGAPKTSTQSTINAIAPQGDAAPKAWTTGEKVAVVGAVGAAGALVVYEITTAAPRRRRRR